MERILKVKLQAKWTTILVGTGYYLAAVAAVAVVFFALVFLEKLENALSERAQDNPIVCVQLENKPGKLGEVASYIGKDGVNITNIDINGEDAVIAVRLRLKVNRAQGKPIWADFYPRITAMRMNAP